MCGWPWDSEHEFHPIWDLPLTGCAYISGLISTLGLKPNSFRLKCQGVQISK